MDEGMKVRDCDVLVLGGISGTSSMGGLAQALVTGRIAGRHAAGQ